MVICQQDRIEHTCPILPQGVDKSDPVWSQVNMRYLKTSQDLQKYAACLHLASVPPAVVIVDSLSSFLQSRSTDKRAIESELIKTMAMLHEATVSLDRWHMLYSVQLALWRFRHLSPSVSSYVVGLTANVAWLRD
ncbi:hypothetical protein ABBQ38_002074 [Trebouxia sp. C0009 RCD-2024]